MAKYKNKANTQTLNETNVDKTTLLDTTDEIVQGIDEVEDEVQNIEDGMQSVEEQIEENEIENVSNENTESNDEIALPEVKDEYEFLLEVNKIKDNELFIEKVVNNNYFKQLITQMDLYLPSYKIGGVEAEDKIANIGEKLINIFKVLLSTDDVHLRRIRIKTIIRIYHLYYLKGLNIIIISVGLQKINKSEKDVNNFHKLSTILLLSENPGQRINYHLRDFDYGTILEDYYSSL